MTETMSTVRIGNAHGFWGDRLEAASEMLAREPELDYLTLDFLAEVSMAILAQKKYHRGEPGFPRDFLEILASLVPYWRAGGRCRVITNAGGLDPLGCAAACQQLLAEAGCSDRKIGIVQGDDVLSLMRADAARDPAAQWLRHLDTGQPIGDVAERLVTANAYLGASLIADALACGADLVVTGRVADPSLTVAACAHHFGWSWDDWDRLAGATVAGHLIECGTQVTGGISTDWLQVPDVEQIGFPIVEVREDGSCVVTLPRGSGGCVDRQTVHEQLLYEIADPDAYVSPDVIASFRSLQVNDEGQNRVRVSGARGRPAPATYKVCATYQDGFRAEGELTVFGRHAVHKARRAAEAVFLRLQHNGVSLRETRVECLGAGACGSQIDGHAEHLIETVLRVAVADDSRDAVLRFTRELMPLITAGPPGITGYADGRPKVHPLFRLWPCLIDRSRISPEARLLNAQPEETARGPAIEEIEVADDRRRQSPARPTPVACADKLAQQISSGPTQLPDEAVAPSPGPPTQDAAIRVRGRPPTPPSSSSGEPWRLRDIAYARSGDKGHNANIGVIVRQAEDFPWLCGELTAHRVARFLGIDDSSRVARYELANLGALNFVVRGILDTPLRVDVQGKALGQVLLEMPLGAQTR